MCAQLLAEPNSEGVSVVANLVKDGREQAVWGREEVVRILNGEGGALAQIQVPRFMSLLIGISSYLTPPGDYGYVRMGNGQSCKIVGIGDVCLETELGCKLLLKKVRHVPEIRLNLISTGQLDDEGYSNEFSNGRWKLSKGLLIVARGQKTDTLYRLRARHNSGQINVVEDYPIELWHRRLGHISEKGIQILARKQSLPVKGMHLSTCDHCLAVERETGMKLKCVRADNGGEYRGPFENYCKTHGIKLEKTVPKTPQQNRLAERMNRTIVERVRCMLSQAKLSKSFWGEAMRASVHIPRDERSKLDAKEKQCIFLGYAHEEFGYRFWDPNSKKIITSRDVVFFEDQTIEDLQKLEKARVGDPHEISIPVSVDVEHPVEEIPGEYEETTTGGEIPQVDDDVTTDDTGSQLQLEPADLPRRSDRIRRPSTKYPPHEYVLLIDGGELQCYGEAVAHEHKEHWLKAMNEEMNSLSENHIHDMSKIAELKKELNIAHSVGVVSRFLSNPGKEHWNAVKWILRYLRGTSKEISIPGNPLRDT
ncbi:hypothetical protein CRG98_033700 [Punica granatum]|uniref:Integrase catalytic domain-containing protein n=1 Tax=Punica granatum TaxID=22663 RepID=A0A2I0IPH9_PUNGR|nr:hypothetical protein CRG98_033700 [Punica granatum]